MKLLISDTNVCIDLYFGNLLNVISALPFEIGISDAILLELIKPTSQEIIEADFKIYSIKSTSVANVFTFAEKYVKPSIQDLFSMVTARDYDAILLTGDKSLRKAAKSEGIEFKGVLWILDSLLFYKVIDHHKAIKSLQSIIDHGARLPKSECDKRIRLWNKN